MYARLLRCAGYFLVLLLAACGGGGDSNKDISPSVPPPPVVVVGADSFLTFPNPLVLPDGTFQTTSDAYATAYYEAIDPLNARDTLAKWKAVNGFDTGTGAQVQVVFGDVRDLGYGRRMTARQNPDGTLAFVVENYLVQLGPDYAYSPVNLNAAVVRDTRWLIGINAIEFSPGPNDPGVGCKSVLNPAGGVCFPKFYNFSPAGARQLAIDLDGRGEKPMPGPCITCHGGRGDPLTPPSPVTGKPLFTLVQNSASKARGDVQAHMHAFAVDTFDFSSTPGFTRASQEATLKLMNQWILCSYPLAGAVAGPEDNCRRPAIPSEWVGSADVTLKQAYGGTGLPNATFSDTYVPPAWNTVGQSSLYQTVVSPYCRACHELRGVVVANGKGADIDFDTFAKFQSYAERTKHHVLDIGNMPLSKLVADNFWASSGVNLLADFLTAQGQTSRDSAGAVLRPGRPVTRLVDRVIKQGATALTAPSTRFATTFAWSVVSGPNGAVPPTNVTLTNATSSTATFNASADGVYVVQLIVGNGAVQSTPATARILVDSTLPYVPSALRFSSSGNLVNNIKPIFAAAGCTGCHRDTGFPATSKPPVFFTDYDRDGVGGYVPAADDPWFYAEIMGRVNLTDSDASPLLRKPAGNPNPAGNTFSGFVHHGGGGLFGGFNITAAPTPSDTTIRHHYDKILNWIMNGAPF
jgi:hypothetical protein